MFGGPMIDMIGGPMNSNNDNDIIIIIILLLLFYYLLFILSKYIGIINQ